MAPRGHWTCPCSSVCASLWRSGRGRRSRAFARPRSTGSRPGVDARMRMGCSALWILGQGQALGRAERGAGELRWPITGRQALPTCRVVYASGIALHGNAYMRRPGARPSLVVVQAERGGEYRGSRQGRGSQAACVTSTVLDINPQLSVGRGRPGDGRRGIAWHPVERAVSRVRECAGEGTESIAGVFEVGTRAPWGGDDGYPQPRLCQE